MAFIGMNASATETGIVMMGTMDEGKCQRKSRMMSATMVRAVVGGDDLHALGQ
jgi:hypothetical protein